MKKKIKLELKIGLLFLAHGFASIVFTILFVFFCLYIADNKIPYNFMGGTICAFIMIPCGFIINRFGKPFLSIEEKGTPKNIHLRMIRFICFTLGGVSLLVAIVSIMRDVILPLF